MDARPRQRWIGVVIGIGLMVVWVGQAGAQDNRVFGAYKFTATEPGFACGGGNETESGKGTIAPIEVDFDPATGSGAFSVDVGGVQKEDNRGFGYVGVSLNIAMGLGDSKVTEAAVGGGGSFGYHGGANERRDLIGAADVQLNRMRTAEGEEGVHSVWQLNGSFRGKLVHAGSTSTWSDDFAGTGEEKGSVTGQFTAILYARLPTNKVDRSYPFKAIKGRIFSVSRGEWVSPGEDAYANELILAPADGPGVELQTSDGITMLLEPGTRVTLSNLGTGPKPVPSYWESTIRVIKGMVEAVINPRSEPINIQGNMGVTAVHGTKPRILVEPDRERVELLEGSVSVHPVNDPDAAVTLAAGEFAEITPDGLTTGRMPADEAARLLRELDAKIAAPSTTGGRTTWKYDGSGCWSVDEGGLVMTGTGARKKRWALYNRVLEDFTFEVDIRKLAGDNDNTAYPFGVFVRADESGQNSYELAITTAGKFRLSRRADGKLKGLMDFTESEALQDGARAWNTIKVVSKGDRISFYANGEFLKALKISGAGAYRSGRMGVFAVDGKGTRRDMVEFREFVLTGP